MATPLSQRVLNILANFFLSLKLYYVIAKINKLSNAQQICRVISCEEKAAVIKAENIKALFAAEEKRFWRYFAQDSLVHRLALT